MVEDIKRYFRIKNAPIVEFNFGEGKFKIEGRSIVEDVESFYGPMHDDLIKYAEQPKEVTYFDFNLEYYNTSSSKWILKLLYILDGISKAGNEVQVCWKYESDDDDMKEAGDDYKGLVSFNIELVPVKV